MTYVWDSAPSKFSLEYEKTWFEVSYFSLVASPSPRQNFVQIAQVTNHFASLRSCLFLQVSTQNSVCISLLHRQVPRVPPTSPPGKYSYCDKCNSGNSSLRNCRQYIATSPLWDPNVFFSIRFPNIGSSSSLTVRHRVQHPYKINRKITVW